MPRRVLCVLLVIFAGVSCSRDPEVVKRKYLQNGNRYFDKGKYKEAYIMYRNALKKDARYSEAYYRVGLTESRQGKMIDALRDFRRAIDTDPNFTNSDARVQAGNILLMAYLLDPKRPPSILADLRDISDKLIKRSPKSVPALRLQGYLRLMAEDKPKEAVAIFRQADQITPNDPDVGLPLVEALIRDEQNAEAEKLAQELVRTHKNFLPIYDVLYGLYLKLGRPVDAEATLKAKVSNNPKDGNALLQLAQHYFRTGRRAEMQSALEKLTSNPKDFPDARLRVGRFYEAARDYDASIRTFEDGVRLEPDKKTDYRKEIAQVLLIQNKKDEAARILEQVLKDSPKDEQAQAMRASLLIETGDPKQVQQAITDLQGAVGEQPTNPVLRFNLGRALWARGQVDQAKLQFQEAVKIRKEYNPARLALAQIQLSRGEFGNAIQTADAALQIDPGNLQAKLIRTNALAEIRRLPEARTELLALVKQHPDSAEAGLQLGTIQLRTGQFREAEELFIALRKKFPADVRPLMGLSDTYAVQNQFDKASEVLQAELTKNPERLDLRGALGNVAYRARQYDVAIRQFQSILLKRPDAADVCFKLGLSYVAKGDIDSAIRTFEQARKLKPNDPAAYLQIALLYEKTGKQAQAKPLYQEILKLQPDHPIALNNLAYIIAETGGDMDQALAFAQRAHQRMPASPEIADTLGWIYIKKNLADNAISVLRDLITKQPDVATYHYHLGMALYQRGDKPQARKELQSALERKPSATEALKIKELMGRIG